MEARATLKYARISPRKVKIVLDLIRNQDADKAMAILKHSLLRPLASIWRSFLASAMANAENNHNMDVSTSLCCRVLCLPGSDSQENPSEGSRQSPQNFEENTPCHNRS